MKITLSITEKTLLIPLGIIILGILFLVYLHFQYQNWLVTPVDSNDYSRIIFSVSKGEPVRSIGKRLEKEDLIPSNFTFYWYLKKTGQDKEVKAGRFALQKSFSTLQIIEILTRHAQGEIVFTIPEGYTLEEIDQKLAEWELIEEGEFIEGTKTYDFGDFEFLAEEESLEGYLFPDTYFLDSQDFEVENFIYRLLFTFQTQIKDLLLEIEKQEKTLHDIIVMASIIEKEVKTDEDRPLVSGILWKRLENDWPLGADATLVYITDDQTIDEEDLELDSPYNTRKNLGLPPAPISNPGLLSIEAALFPEESDYWFYLTTRDTGEVIYALTNEEHNENKQKYL